MSAADDTAHCQSAGQNSENDEGNCIICQVKSCNELVKLTAKGCAGINTASQRRGEESMYADVGDCVHRDCRREYTDPKRIETSLTKTAEKESPTKSLKKRLRCEEALYDSRSHCLFCGKGENLSKKKKSAGMNLVKVSTKNKFQDTVMQSCKTRDDNWSRQVQTRLDFLQDCFAKDVRYHAACATNFRQGLQIPGIFVPSHEPAKKKLRVGRPEDKARVSAFEEVVKYCQDRDYEQLTIRELVQVMKNIMQTDSEEGEKQSPYSIPYMKKKLQEHFGDSIVIAEEDGKPDVLTLKRTASRIIHDLHKEQQLKKAEDESVLVIKAAASLIRREVMEMTSDKSTYPVLAGASAASQAEFIPSTLRAFLSQILSGKDPTLKVASIGQSIIQATRPKTCIAPLQLGLGVQMHKSFGSRYLIDTLHKLGFCSSYSEVQRFQQNAAVSEGVQLPNIVPNQTLQFVADNVDHNSATLDGWNTFHGMGIIAVVTPGTKRTRIVPRKKVDLNDITNLGQIGIHFYRSDWNGLSSVCYKDLGDISADDETAALSTLWKISWPLKSPRPAWNGLMQMTHDGVYSFPGMSEVVFMPMIDLNSGDLSCIYSTLIFICEQSQKCKMTPVVTFDQPLFQKAQSIVCSEGPDSPVRSVVLRLGTFHTQMSFLGCMGQLMGGSGLQEVLELVFAPNAVCHILSGKAHSRAVRAHMLMDAALNALLLADAYDMPWILAHQDTETSETADQEESVDGNLLSDATCSVDNKKVTEDSTPEAIVEAVPSFGHEDLDTAAALFDKLLGGELSILEVTTHDLLPKLQKKLEEQKHSISSSRTSALWLQYLDMIAILQKSIKAERTGNFDLHLQSVAEMLPFFAAAGHHNYVRSARLYLQQMTELKDCHPDLHDSYQAGHHVFRRSERYWAGLSQDLVVEQALMRSLKTSGGLTRGTGFGEKQRLLWLLSMPACAEVNEHMQSLTGVAFSTSYQHKDVSNARQERDHQDTKRIVTYLQSRSPFTSDTALRSIASGRIADVTVNADSAKELGLKILDGMTGKSVLDVVIKKKDQAVTLATKNAVKVDGEAIQVDPQLLFQRLLTIGQSTPESLPSLFEYELANVPSALFDTSGLPREAQKHNLAEYIWSETSQQNLSCLTGESLNYVIDGGSLLHRLPWQRGSSYDQIADTYVQYVTRKYQKATIVFDGYGTSGIKDATHLRRHWSAGVEVNFTGDMILCDTKDKFLSNNRNKQRFVHHLSAALSRNEFETFHSEGDADCDIVKKTLEAATSGTTTCVGEDTDLLILLLFHVKQHHHDVFFASSGTKKAKAWHIQSAQRSVGEDVCGRILFAHAIGGCDTTSRMFSIGKSLPLKLLKKSEHFQKLADIFMRKESEQCDVSEAGEKAVVALYGGRNSDRLNELRYVKYLQKISSATKCAQPKVLPPTLSAAKLHCFRTYFQVQEWAFNECRPPRDPRQWGWKEHQGMLLPIPCDRAAAPDDLLRVIRCKCKKDCRTAVCTCRKHGLVCTLSCGECRGESCLNSIQTVDLEEGSDEEL